MRFTRLNNKSGFTLVEVMVIVPIVVLLIGTFIAVIIRLTGETLAARGTNDLIYVTHDSLDVIERDIKLSNAFLSENSFTPVAPQGSNDDAAVFSTGGEVVLILSTFATTNDPADPDRQLIFLSNQPNSCDSTSVNSNIPLNLNIVYFVKDGSLYRRVLLPQNTDGSLTLPICDGASVSNDVAKVWQQPTCAEEYVNSTTCRSDDSQLIARNVDSYEVKYYSSASSTTEIASPDGATTASVKINAERTVAGRDVSYSAIMRATKRNLVVDEIVIDPILSCPTGFIKVPGNSKFSTSDFCVMKYEAKQASSTVPVSQASGTPWVSINQTNAATYSTNVSNCSGCHLITDNEWLTIAHNVLSVASNWTGGSVGSGSLFRGNSNTTAAMDGTNPLSGVNTRTLTLSNGEVIWDLAGNISEWTNGTITGAGSQPGISGESAYAWKEWNAITTTGSMASSVPSFGTSAASSWTGASNGIGRLYSNSKITSQSAILRGGGWGNSTYAGVFCLALDFAPSDSYTGFGFRVAAPMQ